MTLATASSISPRLRPAMLRDRLTEELTLPAHRLQAFTRLREDLFLDTMDVELLVAKLESQLDYYLTDEEAAQIETIGDLEYFFLR